MDTNNGYMSAIAAKRFQSKLDSLKHQSDWPGLVKMLKRYAVRYPNAYYVYQQLASTLYIESIAQYQLAFQYAERAIIMEPDDDLNIYTYACALYYVGLLDKSSQVGLVRKEGGFHPDIPFVSGRTGV